MFSDTTPTIKELKNAANIVDNVKRLALCKSITPNNPAPNIIGIESKNENLADFFGEIPNNNDAVMVNPDREIPGIIATA